DVRARSDDGVAEIRKVHRLRPWPEACLLHLDEVSDLRARADRCVVAEMREGAEAHVVFHDRLRQEAVIENRDAIPDVRVHDADTAVNLARFADAGAPFERHIRM